MIAATATAASSSSSHGTNLLVPRFVAWTVASLPLTVWVRDSLVDVCRVQGTSMEPVLRDGDILLVRKCDPGALVEGLVDLAASLRSRIVSGVDNNNKNQNVRTTEWMTLTIVNNNTTTTRDQFVPPSSNESSRRPSTEGRSKHCCIT